MEIVQRSHRTTIEMKSFKTAVIPLNHVSNGRVKKISRSIDRHHDHLENGVLILVHDEGNILRDVPKCQKEISEFAVVQLNIKNQTLDSFRPIDQKVAVNGFGSEEEVTFRDHHRHHHHHHSDSRRSSVLDVLGAHNVAEVLTKVDSLEAITDCVRLAGLDHSRLIFGIDYTASNKQQGKVSFGGDSLHHINMNRLNPYQQVISIMGKTLAPLANGGLIPAYGFGDIRTSDTSIFSLKQNGHCKSFDEVLRVYNDITPEIILSGPTNFAPLIYQAIEICKEFRQYHILVIVADGQVTNEADTTRAIVDACEYPLSIILVGVGDGPWDMMKVFDDNLPRRPWDNFHFVEFYKITHAAKNPGLAFAVQALLEIPDQYKKIKALGML